jgi:hypothetical protein
MYIFILAKVGKYIQLTCYLKLSKGLYYRVSPLCL